MADQKIELPNGEQLLFPIGMPDNEIQAAIETEYPQFKASARSALPNFAEPSALDVRVTPQGISTPSSRVLDILTTHAYEQASQPTPPPPAPEAPLPPPGIARAIEERRRLAEADRGKQRQAALGQEELSRRLTGEKLASTPDEVMAQAVESAQRTAPSKIVPSLEPAAAMDIPKTITAAIYQASGLPLQGAGELLARGLNVAGKALGYQPEFRAINPLKPQIDALLDSRTPAAKRAEAESQIQGDLLRPGTWSFGENPSALGYVLHGFNAVAQAAPSLGIALATAGLSVPEQFAVGSLFGGLQGFGGALDQEREAVNAMTDAELMKNSSMYAALIQRGVPNTEARKAVADAAALGGGIGNGTLSGLEQGFENVLVNLLTKGKLRIPSFGGGTAGRVATGTVGGAALGGVEESVEQAGQNIGSNVAIGGERPVGQDTLQNFLMGALGQGAMGGVVGALSPATAEATPPKASLHDELQRVLNPTPVTIHEDLANTLTQGQPQTLTKDQTEKLRELSQKVHTLNTAAILDQGTITHESATAALASKLAHALNLTPEERAQVVIAAEVHDIGKPVGVTATNTPLAPEDLARVRQHPEVGANILAAGGFPDTILEIVKHHHITKGAGGYPAMGAEEKASLASQIVHLADVVAATGMKDPGHLYVKDANIANAMAIIDLTSQNFDPRVVQAFKDLVAKNALPHAFQNQGTQERPVAVQSAADIARAAQQVNTQPTEAQKHAGNYAKGHITWNGLPISIENPRGSTRSGTDPTGAAWSVRMPVDYGYIKQTKGADKDHQDVYLGPNPASQTVFVIDQIDPATGKFDEHKNMLGFDSADQAVAAYQQAFTDTQQRIGNISQVSLEDFKTWLREGNMKKPLARLQRRGHGAKNKPIPLVAPETGAATQPPDIGGGRVPSVSGAYGTVPTPVPTPAPELVPQVAGRETNGNIAVAERRTDRAARKQVAEMTPEELRYALLTDHLTDTNNRRAYEEAIKLPIQAAIDVDSLKWVNDNLGHKAGDELLQKVAAALKAQTGETYHISGDEFVVQGRTVRAVNMALKAAQKSLQAVTLGTGKPGETMNGVGFSYGVGKSLDIAEQGMQANKLQREKSGLRAARGETPPTLVAAKPKFQQSVAAREGLPSEIEVDGVMRPTLNSTGKPIHPTAEGVRNFWRWFGDSKVVDAKGRPLVVYHGTDKAFSKIDLKKGAQGLFWFTSDKLAIEAGNVGAAGRGVIMELYAKINNPAGWKQYDSLMLDEFKARGLDGAVLPERDGALVGFVMRKDETQIKSATGNTGAFSPANANILRSVAGYQPTYDHDQQIKLLRKKFDVRDVDAEDMYQNGDRIDPVTGDFYGGGGKGYFASEAVSEEETFAIQRAHATDEAAILAEIKKEQPGWMPYVEKLLVRGKAGERGGLVIGTEAENMARASELLAKQKGAQPERAMFELLESDRTEAIAQTDTPEFKRWFGNSKVVDSSGKPLVVYHGTAADFDAFKRRVGDIGIHFGTAGQANERISYTSKFPTKGKTVQVLPVYLSIQHPLRLEDAGRWDPANLAFALQLKFPNDRVSATPNLWDAESKTWKKAGVYLKTTKDIREYIQSKGYDGVVYKNTGEVPGTDELRERAMFDYAAQRDLENFIKEHGEDSYIAFERTQIKSALSNTGAFSKRDPRIQFSQQWYYSQLQQAIRNAPDRLFANGKQVKTWLESNAPKLGVKKDELIWTGITDWLETQGKISKADVLAFIESNGVQVQETQLSETKSPAGWTAEKRAGSWMVTDENGRQRGAAYAVDNEEDAIEQIASTVGVIGNPKFSAYQLPGGENYKELLLTLPEPVNTNTKRIQELQAQYDDLLLEKLSSTNIEENSRQLRNTETQMRLAKKEGEGRTFQSAHYPQRNILAHIRFNERTDAAGKRVLFLEEVQSDWGQKGKKEGFAPKGELKESDVELKRVGNGDTAYWEMYDKRDGSLIVRGNGGFTREQAISDAMAFGNRKTIQSAPFVTDTKSWTALALKRMIRYAAENGFDSIAWTTGEQQSERYDLSKQIESIESVPVKMEDEAGTILYTLKATDITGAERTMRALPEHELEENVGKELAKKIIKAGKEEIEARQNYRNALRDFSGIIPKSELDALRAKIDEVQNEWSGLDLKVGGEGMKGYYDQIVPQVANDILKKIGGGRVEPISIDAGTMKRDTDGVTRFQTIEQQGFTITPDLKAKVLGEGLPLFSTQTKKTQGFYAPELGIAFINSDAVSAKEAIAVILHEMTHSADTRGEMTSLGKEVLNRLEKYSGIPVYARVRARMEKAGQSGNANEALNYLVEEALQDAKRAGYSRLDSGFFGWLQRQHFSISKIIKRWIAAIRAALYNHGKLKADSLTIDDMIAVAVSGMKEVATGKREAAKSQATTQPSVSEEGTAARPSDFTRDRIKDVLTRTDWAILTAENPNAQTLSPQENAKLNTRFTAELDSQGLEYIPVQGKYGDNEEHSFLILGVTRQEAMALREQFQQESVLTRDGLVYADGTVNPALKVNVFTQAPDNFYSRLPDGTTFSVEIDFDKKLPLPAGTVRVGEVPPLMGAHFSPAQRGVLSGAFYGTNNPGAEREFVRQSPDSRLRSRLYFYVDEGRGVTPEVGVGTVRHNLLVSNLYDGAKNPLKLPTKDANGVWDPRAFESAVLDAGFSGYYIRGGFGHQGVGVLLGKASEQVPVQQEFQQSVQTLQQGVVDNLKKVEFDYVDEFAPLHDWQKTLGKVPEAQDASLAQQRYSGIVAARVDDLHADMINPLLEELHNSGLSYEDLEQYLYARHAPSRNIEMEKINPGETALSGMSDTEAQQIIQNAKVEGTEPTLRALADRVYTITAKTRENLVKGGLLTSEEKDAWEQKYQDYVPLHRDEVNSTQPALGKGFSIKGKESKRALGAKARATNILAHVFAQHEASIIRAEKNKVSRAMFELLSAHPDPAVGLIDSPDLRKVLDKSLGVVTFRYDPLYKNSPDVLVLKIDGEEHTVSFNPQETAAHRMAVAFKNLGGKELGEITQLVGKFTRFLATMSTSANPVFLARNFLRDLQTAAVNLNDTPIKNKARVFAAVPAAMGGFYQMSKGKLSSKWAQLAREFRDEGGQVGWLQQYKDIQDRAQHYKDLVADMSPGVLAASKRAMLGWWGLVEDANSAVENAVRLAAYAQAKAEGIPKAEAAMIAKNLTVNFNIRGAKSVELNMWYMFAKASINGTLRMFRAAKNPKVRKIMAGMVVVGFLLDALARGLAGDDDKDGQNDYDQLPEHVKANSWVFWVTGRPVTVPQSYGLNFFPNVGRKVSQLLFQKGYHVGEAAQDIFNVAVNAYSPVGSGGSVLQTVMPTIADPFIQLAENKNFAGQPIRKEQLGFGAPKPEYQMGFKSASAMSQAITEWLNNNTGGNQNRPGLINLNPSVMDFAVASVFGGAGKTYTQVTSLPMKLLTDKEIEPREIPFANIFIGTKPQQQSQQKYYEALKQIKIVEKEFKDPAVVSEDWKKEHATEIALVGYAKRVDARVRKVDEWLRDLPTLRANEPALDRLERQIRTQFSQYTPALDKALKAGSKADAILKIEQKVLEDEKLRVMNDFNKKYFETVVK